MVLADWTKEAGVGEVTTDPASGTPSVEPALKITNDNIGEYALLTYNTAHKHTHGRITTYHKGHTTAVGNSKTRLICYYKDLDNYYYVAFGYAVAPADNVKLWKRISAAETEIAEFGQLPDGYRPHQGWQDYRVTWWLAGGVLYFRFEYKHATLGWTQLGTDKPIPSPMSPADTDKYGVFARQDYANGYAVYTWMDKTILEYKN